MKLLKQAELQLIFKAKALKTATIVKAPDSEGGYNLMFKGDKSDQYAISTQRDSKAIRRFMKIDSAVSTAESIGFKTIQIKL